MFHFNYSQESTPRTDGTTSTGIENPAYEKNELMSIEDIVNSPNSQPFKIISIDKIWTIVPRESYLKKLVSELNASKPHFLVRPYMGEMKHLDCKYQHTENESDEISVCPDCGESIDMQRTLEGRAVSELPEFDNTDQDYLERYDTENGRIVDEDDNAIDRGLVLIEKSSNQIVGAIVFGIDFDENTCYIHKLGIKDSNQGDGLGKLLLNTAMLQAIHYGCHQFNLLSTEKGKGLYLSHGFKPEPSSGNDNYDLGDLLRKRKSLGDNFKLNLLEKGPGNDPVNPCITELTSKMKSIKTNLDPLKLYKKHTSQLEKLKDATDKLILAYHNPNMLAIDHDRYPKLAKPITELLYFKQSHLDALKTEQPMNEDIDVASESLDASDNSLNHTAIKLG